MFPHIIRGTNTREPNFPVVEASAIDGDTVHRTSHYVNLPSGIVSGELLLMFLTIDGSSSSVNSLPAGWTVTSSGLITGASATYAVCQKAATGSEGGTVIVGVTPSESFSSVVIRVSNADSAIQYSSLNSATGTNVTYPALTDGGGGPDNLWIAVTYITNAGSNLATGPAGYTDPIKTTLSGGSSATNTAIATLQESTASETPPNGTLSASAYKGSQTICVNPA